MSGDAVLQLLRLAASPMNDDVDQCTMAVDDDASPRHLPSAYRAARVVHGLGWVGSVS